MKVQTRRPRIMLAGSCDVDNFGDLLYLLVTEPYLADADLVPTGPFGWDMEPLLDRRIQAYAPLLATERFDAIWTLGGERMHGGLEGAFKISAPPELYERYEQATSAGRRKILAAAAGGEHALEPYFPAGADYPLNAGAVSVLNSAGLVALRHADPDRRAALLSLLRHQAVVVVRDQESSELLAEAGIGHRLAPDAVHALGVLRPRPDRRVPDLAIVQVNGVVVDQIGIGRLADVLARSRQLSNMRIRVLMSGTLRGIDPVDRHRELVRQVRLRAAGADIELIEDRRPLDLVDHLRQARVVIGTSLHVRIVSSAYRVPRVTLSPILFDKPSRYARVWDPLMPYDVAIEGLDEAVGRALAAESRPEVVRRSGELARMAHDGLETLARDVMQRVARQTSDGGPPRHSDARLSRPAARG